MADPVTLQTITFSEQPLGTVDPEYAFPGILPDRTFRVNFTGEIVNDGSNPTSPAIAANTSYTGPVTITFNYPVSGFSLGAGVFNAVKSTKLIIEGPEGFVLKRVFNSSTTAPYENFTFDYGENVIEKIRLVPVGDEPAGFAVDNLSVIIRPEARDAAAAGDEAIDNLLGGTAWNGNVVTYSFLTAGSKLPGYGDTPETFAGSANRKATSAPFSEGQKAMTVAALGMWDDVSNLIFDEVNDTGPAPGMMRFGVADIDAPADAFKPSNFAWAGDVRVDVAESTDQALPGSYMYATFIHEVGHALGLKHPHGAGGTGVTLPPNRDSLEFSVMSYRGYPGESTDGGGFVVAEGSYPQTLMMNDIAAIQYLYGANFNHNSGDTVYDFDPGKAKVFETIWDGGGTDTYDASAYLDGVVLDLNPGKWSVLKQSQLAELKPDPTAPILARGSVFNARLYQNDDRSLIENAIGGNGHDTLRGNRTENFLRGRGGNDTLDGLAGRDILRGDGGNDKLYGGSATDKLMGGDQQDQLTGGLGKDKFIFAFISESAAGADARDTITDFEQGSDKINLKAMDANAVAAGSQEWVFVGAGAFSGAGTLRYEQSVASTRLLGDANGDGNADFAIFVAVSVAFAADDLILI